MKKVLALICALSLVLALAACGSKDGASEAKSEGVMTYAEYAAAALDSEVTIEAYVQAHQSWWDDKVTVYAADKDGAYFMYNMACSEEDISEVEHRPFRDRFSNLHCSILCSSPLQEQRTCRSKLHHYCIVHLLSRIDNPRFQAKGEEHRLFG